MPDITIEAGLRLDFDLFAPLTKDPPGVTEAPLQIQIAGENITGLYRPASLKVQDRLNGRKTASFILIDEATTYRPIIGEDVKITWNDTTVFAGEVEDTEETEAWIPVNFLKVSCTDYNRLCDRFLIATTYEVEGQTLREIVRNLVEVQRDGALAAEGVTAVDFVDEGPAIGKTVFNYRYHTDCFNQLSEITGLVWWVDDRKRLHFVDPVGQEAPLGFNDTLGNYRAVSIRSTRRKYRNRQFFRGGTARTAKRVEAFVGDATLTTFTLKFSIDNIGSWKGTGDTPSGSPDGPPLVTLNTVPQTVGIRGAEDEADYQWVYQRGENTIAQSDTPDEPITALDRLEVTYYGQFPVIIDQIDFDEVDARQAVEGGTGEYHSVETDEDVDTTALAVDRTAGLLSRFGFLPEILRVDSDEIGIEAGQTVAVDFPQHGITGELLCTRVTLRDISSGDEYLRFSYQLERSKQFEDWVEFWRRLTAALGPRTVRENEQVSIVRPFRELVEIVDDFVDPPSVKPGDLIGGNLDPYSWNWYGEPIPAIGTPPVGFETIPGMVHGFSRHGPHPNA